MARRPTTEGTGRRPAARARDGRTLRATAALVLALASACRATPAATPRPHTVRYLLTWTADGVAREADGAWTVTNDLGYRVHVRRGWVTSYSTELVECPKDARAWSLFADTAFAGHLSGTPNPAAVKPMRVESLTQPAESEAGVVTLAPQPYCQLHYLVARAGHDSPGLPAELDMVDTTLHVEGTYRAADAATDTAFTIHSASAYGQLFPLRVDTGREGGDVVLQRRLAALVDGVDFARMPEKTAALQILRALVDHVAVEVRRRDANG